MPIKRDKNGAAKCNLYAFPVSFFLFTLSAVSCKPSVNVEGTETKSAPVMAQEDFLLIECVMNNNASESVSAFVRQSAAGESPRIVVEKKGKILGKEMTFDKMNVSYVGMYSDVTFEEQSHCAPIVLTSTEEIETGFNLPTTDPQIGGIGADEPQAELDKQGKNKPYKVEIGQDLPSEGSKQCTFRYLDMPLEVNKLNSAFSPNNGYACRINWPNMQTFIKPLVKK